MQLLGIIGFFPSLPYVGKLGKHCQRHNRPRLLSLTLELEKASQKNVFFGRDLLNVVGGVADSQTRSKPLKKKTRLFFTQISPFVFPNLTKPWGGWVGKHIWERYPKKKVFLAASLRQTNKQPQS